ncbi:MAG: VOC family protein [Longimicrobiales bacterium]
MSAQFTVSPPGHRLPDAATLGSVRLQISDLNRSIAFYETVLGLRVLERSAHTALLGAQGDSEPLVALHELTGAAAVPRGGRLGLFHFALLLPDRASLGSFLAHVSEMGLHVGAADHLVSEALYLSDPDGLGIEVYADRPRESWRMDGATLAMGTDPLDMDSLLAAAHDTPWQGAPSGTRIGHVHLRVSDLAQAERFFHNGVGFDRIVLGYPGALFMSAGGYHHHLGTNTWAARAPAAVESDARLLEWTLIVPSSDDVTAVGKSIGDAGFETANSGADVTASDPWGTGLRVTSATR